MVPIMSTRNNLLRRQTTKLTPSFPHSSNFDQIKGWWEVATKWTDTQLQKKKKKWKNGREIGGDREGWREEINICQKKLGRSLYFIPGWMLTSHKFTLLRGVFDNGIGYHWRRCYKLSADLILRNTQCPSQKMCMRAWARRATVRMKDRYLSSCVYKFNTFNLLRIRKHYFKLQNFVWIKIKNSYNI